MNIQQMRTDIIGTASFANYASRHDDAVSGNDAKDRVHSNTTVNQVETASFSKEALDALEKSVISDAIDTFLSEKGQSLYETAIKSLKVYPEDLAAKLDDKSLPEKERTEIANALNERELNAFGKYIKQSPPDRKMYYEKYIEYLDSLSPEEQQSDRYRGQRALVVPLYERFCERTRRKSSQHVSRSRYYTYFVRFDCRDRLQG